MRNLSIGGVIGRFLASLILVVATFNPTGYSFVGWIAGHFPHLEPLQLVVGIALSALWLFFLHSTWRSLGTVGVVLGIAFFAAMVWLFTSWGWFSLSNHNALIWVVLVMMACLLTLGLCWALLQARIAGQAVVEEVKR
ncbi:MAG TPA: DUF6524 family protein [Steroidobacteraceae bacterium]|jgi:hypothetical protein|nr:DUF6524 family protein [Steroidobacteraceae bacterium]